MAGSNESYSIVQGYHEETKHQPHRYARSAGYMDWANEPVPFRFYDGAERIFLPLLETDRGMPHTVLNRPFAKLVERLSLQSISAFLELGMGLSAWKQYGGSEWVLRMNPSSGNLHPTECSLLLPPVDGHGACLAHYNPLLHCLEIRAFFNEADRSQLERISGFGVILSSICWRESWKYGERAFRYCQLDVGHALCCLSMAANLNGWHMRMQGATADEVLDRLLGFDIFNRQSPEEELAECLCWVGDEEVDPSSVSAFIEQCRPPVFRHPPNRLSSQYVDWPIISEASRHSRSPGFNTPEKFAASLPLQFGLDSDLSAESIIRKRRSAQAFNRSTSRTDLPTLLHILACTLPAQAPLFGCFPLPARVHLAIFVHNVEGLEAGLYFLLRNAAHFEQLRSELDGSFAWTAVHTDLPLYRLMKGDFRHTASAIACHQEIAGDSAFSLGMIAQFEEPLRENPWLYPRLHWECGFIGQVLYLEAEAHSLRGTGIGCFFDDLMHDRLGLSSRQWQDLYHFTVGKHLDDPRLQTKPPYYNLRRLRGAVSPA